jgi:hypothetical protein
VLLQAKVLKMSNQVVMNVDVVVHVPRGAAETDAVILHPLEHVVPELNCPPAEVDAVVPVGDFAMGDLPVVVVRHAAVSVPMHLGSKGRAAPMLHEADAVFEQSAGHQTGPREALVLCAIDTIHPLSRGGLLTHIGRLWNRQLHSRGR